jgi:hypothetical protein
LQVSLLASYRYLLVKSVSLFDLLHVTTVIPHLQFLSPYQPSSKRYCIQARSYLLDARFID